MPRHSTPVADHSAVPSLVAETGFEPVHYGLWGRCSTELNYSALSDGAGGPLKGALA